MSYVCSISALFVCCVGTHVDNISHFRLLMCFRSDKKVSRVLLFEKMYLRNCIKFSVKTEIKCARTFEMLTAAFGESPMSRTQVQLWYNRYIQGRENVNGDTCPGRSSTSTTDENIELVKQMISDNCRTTFREVADDAGISFGS